MSIRLHTQLKVKRLHKSDGGRWIAGTASTPTTDRMGDIVRPEGAEYRLPLVLLAYHDHSRPVGSVVEANVSPARIVVKAKLAEGSPDADTLWSLLEDGCPLALSIGFQSLETKPLPGGGTEFVRWSWFELSVVSVPANPDAQINTVGKMLVQRSGSEPVPAPEARQSSRAAAPFDPELFGQAVGEAIQKQLEPLRSRIAALEGRHV